MTFVHEEHALARVAIAEHSGERRDERGGDEAGEEDEPDRALASDVVGVHGDRDQERVLADDRRRPRKLQPAQVGVPPDRCERT